MSFPAAPCRKAIQMMGKNTTLKSRKCGSDGNPKASTSAASIDAACMRFSSVGRGKLPDAVQKQQEWRDNRNANKVGGRKLEDGSVQLRHAAKCR